MSDTTDEVGGAVDAVCAHVVAVTEGRVTRQDLDAESLLWSHDGDRSVGLDSLEIMALLYRLDEVAGRPLPAQFELMPSVTVGDVASFLASSRHQ